MPANYESAPPRRVGPFGQPHPATNVPDRNSWARHLPEDTDLTVRSLPLHFLCPRPSTTTTPLRGCRDACPEFRSSTSPPWPCRRRRLAPLQLPLHSQLW